ncbi:hypothetical protein [Oceanirhabdus seepicola]|uniref:Uncharacterized protein n=1 Tax=Oceanirhabdus seepicola TaxID=2828781 RepID=A0A9J6P0C4_9CLOT|nr:hypothetical protein [Oceanirhabdus seepicola]MCM1988872.1 hypothetical protein [Oceanirhabdus seepicola]
MHQDKKLEKNSCINIIGTKVDIKNVNDMLMRVDKENIDIIDIIVE